jgi:hypothetical protein
MVDRFGRTAAIPKTFAAPVSVRAFSCPLFQVSDGHMIVGLRLHTPGEP